MSDEIDMEFTFDAPPEKVWRAVSIAQYRERWLPGTDLAQEEPVAVEEGSAVSYRMRDALPPHEESVVTFSVTADGRGGTRLGIVQQMRPAPANANDTVMLAA
ncbi:hypothetical protein NO932_12140 [Pelagibacterium sp. 26DY04]|uniref:SRPBCC family protein n=1 Tax=Pelagibacterium sp. 26DY04 TaxID=2967130 RepID=UPI002814D64B|nr:hypothetical protein [Pelagibacterium sp. 26DY04]WMT85676.1 hypothetical protein NO932_12140 [Pelagibacterium sp. 26DY04]